MKYFTLSFDRDIYFRLDGEIPTWDTKDGHFLTKGKILQIAAENIGKLQHTPACAHVTTHD